MSHDINRLTLYALIGGVESDLRNLINNYLSTSVDKIKPKLRELAEKRLVKDLGFKLDDLEMKDLVDYFDMSDTYQFINENFSELPDDVGSYIKSLTHRLQEVVPVRNRVMHIRPLNVEDFEIVTTFCKDIVSQNRDIWREVEDVLNKLSDNSSYVLTLEIIKYDSEDISHNLPLPDFDETGLIGRKKEVEEIKKKCIRGAFPVISLIGEGGIGKTAVALQVAYDLLEDPNSPFEAIIWVSSKTTQITVNEIIDIKGAISDSIGVINAISTQIQDGSKDSAKNLNDRVEEIHDYLSEYKVLLFIDNLETILDDNVRMFIDGLPMGSKVVLTSRIGMGAYDSPIMLKGMEPKYATQLLRTVAKLRGVESLSNQNQDILLKYVNRMYCNPSFIKWFVNCVQAGIMPELVLQKSSELFLEFCMSNVYNYLSENAKLVLSAMVCAPGYVDIPELDFLTEFGALKLQKTIQELMATNMLSQTSEVKGASIKTIYQLSELSRSYLNKHHKPSPKLQSSILAKKKQLSSTYERQRAFEGLNKYEYKHITLRNKRDRVIAKRLQEILSLIDKEHYDKAFDELDQCRILAPDYFEVARVAAYYYEKQGDIHSAKENYELSIKLYPNVSQLHFWYGYFLLEKEGAEEAVPEFIEAKALDPESAIVNIYLARAYLFQHEFELSKGILIEIKDLIKNASLKLQKMFFDINIQILYRSADKLASANDFLGSLVMLEQMSEEFDRLHKRFKDTYMRRKLLKCNFTVHRIANGISKSELKRVDVLRLWLIKNSPSI
ncbi:NB-ARC domain-containing protein [Neisseriaceae bacterium CLB008]